MDDTALGLLAALLLVALLLVGFCALLWLERKDRAVSPAAEPDEEKALSTPPKSPKDEGDDGLQLITVPEEKERTLPRLDEFVQPSEEERYTQVLQGLAWDGTVMESRAASDGSRRGVDLPFRAEQKHIYQVT